MEWWIRREKGERRRNVDFKEGSGEGDVGCHGDEEKRKQKKRAIATGRAKDWRHGGTICVSER